MELAKALQIFPGITAIIGAGGKTTLLLALARELSEPTRVIVTTTTHIYPPPGLPCLLSPSADVLAQSLEQTSCVCVGAPAKEGKLTEASLPMTALSAAADFVLVEADGALLPYPTVVAALKKEELLCSY